MTDKELMQMALDAFEWNLNTDLDNISACEKWIKKAKKNIDALRARLAQPEQEPVAWGIANTRPTEKQPLMMVMLDKPKPSHLVVPLYTTPPQRERIVFPTMLRKMWSGTEVQAWLDENVNKEKNND